MGNVYEYLKAEIEKHKREYEEWQERALKMESDEMVLICFEESKKHECSANALIGVLNFLN